MPKKEILYVCETCGTKYQLESKAKECERSHRKLVEIKEAVYDSRDRKKEFPAMINVKFESYDGQSSVISYYRKQP